AAAQEHPEGGGGQSLAEAGDDTAGDEDVLGGALVAEGLGRCGRPDPGDGAGAGLGCARARVCHGRPTYHRRGAGARISSSWARRSSARGSSRARRREAVSARRRASGARSVLTAAASASASPTGTRCAAVPVTQRVPPASVATIARPARSASWRATG